MANSIEVEKHILKMILINMSRCNYYLNLLGSYSGIKCVSILSEEVPENERITIPIEKLEFEINLHKHLLHLKECTTVDANINNQNLNDFISEIQIHRLFKTNSPNKSYSYVWTYFLDFLIKQWDFKTRRMILKHFNALEYIEHLTDVDKRQIKFLGRSTQSLNPHAKLLGKMISFIDDFRNNERECKSFEFSLLHLSLSKLRCRFDKKAVSEMITDNFSYRLQTKNKFHSESDEFIRNQTVFSSNIPTSFNKENNINKKLNASFDLKPIFGFKNEIRVYPIFLTFCIDRCLEAFRLDGSAVTINSNKTLKFATVLTADDFKDQTLEEELKYTLIAVQTTRGSFFIRQNAEIDDGWLKIKSKKMKTISSDQFNKIFTTQKAEILIYNRNIF